MLEHETFYEYLRIIIKLIWEEEGALHSFSLVTLNLGQAVMLITRVKLNTRGIR